MSDEEEEERIDAEAESKKNAKIQKAKYEEISAADIRRKARLEDRLDKLLIKLNGKKPAKQNKGKSSEKNMPHYLTRIKKRE